MHLKTNRLQHSAPWDDRLHHRNHDSESASPQRRRSCGVGTPLQATFGGDDRGSERVLLVDRQQGGQWCRGQAQVLLVRALDFPLEFTATGFSPTCSATNGCPHGPTTKLCHRWRQPSAHYVQRNYSLHRLTPRKARHRPPSATHSSNRRFARRFALSFSLPFFLHPSLPVFPE